MLSSLREVLDISFACVLLWCFTGKHLNNIRRYIPLVPGQHPGETFIHDDVDLTQVGNTTIFRTNVGEDGHWHMNGGAISLLELFDKFGDDFTVSELMLWYWNAPNVFGNANILGVCQKSGQPLSSV